jgi:ArsR family transcriptional regulator, arsenate/arsenite/antimonite-responsive transcriptional repressor
MDSTSVISHQRKSPTNKATDTEPPCCTPVEVIASEGDTVQMAALADRLRALADPTRLRMLDLLVQQSEPLCVCEMTNLFPQQQPTISHHLRLLREAGLISMEKRGTWSYYWATYEGRRALAAAKSLL